jgi:sugar lactone lactonase YvrE
VLQEDEDGTAWLDAGNGYVHRRMPDGDFDQTIFVPNPDGDGFVPNEA